MWRGAGVDGDHVRAVVVAGDLIGNELSPVNGGVPTVTCGNTVPLTRAPPVSGSSWLGVGTKCFSTFFQFLDNT